MGWFEYYFPCFASYSPAAKEGGDVSSTIAATAATAHLAWDLHSDTWCLTIFPGF